MEYIQTSLIPEQDRTMYQAWLSRMAVLGACFLLGACGVWKGQPGEADERFTLEGGTRDQAGASEGRVTPPEYLLENDSTGADDTTTKASWQSDTSTPCQPGSLCLRCANTYARALHLTR